MRPIDSDPPYRTPAAAEYIGVSPKTLANWRVIGCGPEYEQAGRIIIYRKSRMDAWRAVRQRRSTSESADS